jgi:hypothetical protein
MNLFINISVDLLNIEKLGIIEDSDEDNDEDFDENNEDLLVKILKLHNKYVLNNYVLIKKRQKLMTLFPIRLRLKESKIKICRKYHPLIT